MNLNVGDAIRGLIILAVVPAILAGAGTASWAGHKHKKDDSAPAEQGGFAPRSAGLSDQVTQLERIVFTKSFEDDALLNRVARLTHELLASEEESIAALSLTDQVERLWQALNASHKYAGGGKRTPQPRGATTSTASTTSGADRANRDSPSQPGDGGRKDPPTDPYELNHRIMTYVSERFGQQVGNGECWTLAEEALKAAGASPPREYVFGRELKKGEEWWPGDIVQFTSCKFKETLPGGGKKIVQAGSPNHTAIFGGKQNGMSMIAQQNVNGRKTVMMELLDFKSLVSGSYKVYRAVPPHPSSSAPSDSGAAVEEGER